MVEYRQRHLLAWHVYYSIFVMTQTPPPSITILWLTSDERFFLLSRAKEVTDMTVHERVAGPKP